ncbi:tRNA (guanine37-N1)-methyltransferase [Nematocida sp. LUAm3]|nr:tRNA (guanine37-N1)-methyltransferase [Nematocida sp. LUAm3]KAI5175877.1 tRNA (guanine37-N1)-methyltransferase [Nematocida sp. LUAm2]KAI5178741.1 tRNA (guanine37-N1)-methyltransferase [Nematocida sp. LUAm1]
MEQRYKEIAEGRYKEEVPCKVKRVKKREIEKTLKESEEVLSVRRIPRVLNWEVLREGKKGFWVKCEEIDRKPDEVLVLLKEEASGGYPGVLVLGYKYFTHGELLKRAGIPENEYLASYNRIGSIIHLNLKEESLRHKEIISKVLYDKINECKTVIAKSGNISSKYRNIDIIHLQGEKNYKSTHRENGLIFSISYDKVYWNSKLQQERSILCEVIREGDTLCDMFCGVGPFSILCLSKGATTYSNDLNPESIKNFKESIILNRKNLQIESDSCVWNDGIEERVHLYNMEAKEFLSRATEDYNREKEKSEGIELFDHYMLNLPELTLNYLELFIALEKASNGKPAYVHAYFFLPSGEDAQLAVERIMKRSITCTTRMVRKVSPAKEMWLVSYLLTNK